MAYLAESGVWRNFSFSGARELTDSSDRQSGDQSPLSDELLAAISTEMSLEYMAIRLNAPKPQDFELTMALSVAESDETSRVSVARVLVLDVGVVDADAYSRARVKNRS